MKKVCSHTIVFIFLSVIFSCLHAEDTNDFPAVHGMLVVGQKDVYLSHLPMFHSPHDYQGIFKVDMGDATKKIYLESLKKHPEIRVYTLVPEPFILPVMAKDPKPFKASLFRGHFERGGLRIAKDFEVKISQAVYFKKFIKNAKQPKTSNYILFGSEDELFAAHFITAAPDFDHILKIDLHEGGAITKLLAEQSHLSIVFDAVDNKTPLHEKSEFLGLIKSNSDEKIKIKTDIEYYLEFGDLEH